MKKIFCIAFFILMVASAALSLDIDSLDSNQAVDIEKGGTNASSASGARTNLGLEINVDVQAHDADLDIYSGITPSDNVQSLLGAATYAAFKALLDLEIGTDVQAYDIDLDTAATGGAAGNSKFFGTNGAGVVGWLDQSTISGTSITDGTAAGDLTQWDGDSWEPISSLANMTISGGTANRVAVWDGDGELASGSRAEGVIDSGTGPTVDAAGKIAVDTTTDQLAYFGGAKRVLPYIQYAAFVLPAPADADDMNLLKAPYGMTILGISCIVQGSTSVTGQIQECTSAGASCADLDSDITCDSDGAADDGTLTDNNIDSGDWVRWKTTSVSGTPTFLTVTVKYSVVSD